MIKRVLKTFLFLAAGLSVNWSAAASTITYYHNDLLGSPAVATDASGNVVWRESYRPYGERLVNSAAATGNQIWFTGRRQDPETGLVYMGARYYDPITGRFVSTDPKMFDPSRAMSFNRYAYANDNPYKYVDPDGRQETTATLTQERMQREYLEGKITEQQLKDVYEAQATGATIGLMFGGGLGPVLDVGAGALSTGTAVRDGEEVTRVGRWMSKAEFEEMSGSGRVVEGGGGRTSVIRPPNPSSFKPPPSSDVYAEFDVPTGALRQGGKPDWAIIPGPNIQTRIFGPAPAEMPPATCIVCVIGN